jgi:hypothetical protein
MWNLEGMRVKGMYLSGDVPVSGKVTLAVLNTAVTYLTTLNRQGLSVEKFC